MKMTFAKEIQDDASLKVAAGKINSVLAGIVLNVTDQITAEWELAGDPKSRTLFLRLWYEDQATGMTFHPADLDDPYRLKSKLRDMWDDLLQARSDRLIREMNAILAREEVAS